MVGVGSWLSLKPWAQRPGSYIDSELPGVTAAKGAYFMEDHALEVSPAQSAAIRARRSPWQIRSRSWLQRWERRLPSSSTASSRLDFPSPLRPITSNRGASSCRVRAPRLRN